MAVHVAHRRRGIGRALLFEVLRIAAAEAFPPVFLHAQTSVLPFYAGVGFVPEGGVFEEAGIAHQRMRMDQMDISTLGRPR
jgi:predicted GNAT family N-acyltransferase